MAVSSSTEVGRIHFWYQRCYLAFGAWGQSSSLTVGYITHTEEFRIANNFHAESDNMFMSNTDYFGGDTNKLGFGFASDPPGLRLATYLRGCPAPARNGLLASYLVPAPIQISNSTFNISSFGSNCFIRNYCRCSGAIQPNAPHCCFVDGNNPHCYNSFYRWRLRNIHQNVPQNTWDNKRINAECSIMRV